MPQSSVIAAYLIIAFVVFITMRGELQAYMGFLFSSGAATGGTQSAENTTNLTPQTALTAADMVQAAELMAA